MMPPTGLIVQDGPWFGLSVVDACRLPVSHERQPEKRGS